MRDCKRPRLRQWSDVIKMLAGYPRRWLHGDTRLAPQRNKLAGSRRRRAARTEKASIRAEVGTEYLTQADRVALESRGPRVLGNGGTGEWRLGDSSRLEGFLSGILHHHVWPVPIDVDIMIRRQLFRR